MPTDLYSLGSLVGVLIGAIVVAALIFGITLGVDEAPDLPGFLRRRPAKKDDPRSVDANGELEGLVRKRRREPDLRAPGSKSLRKEKA